MPNQIQMFAQDADAILFGSEVGDDVAWTTESLAGGSGRQSAFHDLGAAPRALLYKWRFWTQLQATPTLGARIELYLKTGGTESGTLDHPDNDDGTGDIAVSSSDKLVNLTLIGSLIVDEAAASVEMVAKGFVEIPERHISVVMWNASSATTSATESHTKFRLTPVFEEIQ